VIWDRTSLLAFHSHFAELLFTAVCADGLFVQDSSGCAFIYADKIISVHAFLVSDIVYVARLCVVCKAVFFNHQRCQHVIIIERC